LDIAKIFFPNASVPEDQVEELTINMRTTREICEYAAEYFLKEDEAVQMINQSKYCRSDLNSSPQEEGRSDATLQKEQVLTWIKLTLNDTSDFAVFCPETPIVDEYYEYLVDKGFSVAKYHSKEGRRDAINLDKQVLVTTYQSSKGLEADYVILIITKEKYDEYLSAEDGAAATQPERFESLDSVSKERPAVAPVRDRTPVAEHSVRPDGVPALDTRQSVQNTGDDLAGISDEVRRHILAGQLAMEVQLQRDPSVAGMRAIAKVLHDNTTLTHLQKIDFLIGFGRALHQSGLPRQQEALLIRAIAEAF